MEEPEKGFVETEGAKMHQPSVRHRHQGRGPRLRKAAEVKSPGCCNSMRINDPLQFPTMLYSSYFHHTCENVPPYHGGASAALS